VRLIAANIRRAHEPAHGYAADDKEIEPVHWKASATATMPRANRTPVAAPARASAPVREQAVRYVDAAGTISTQNRDDLRVEQPVHGPAVVTEMDATTFVPPTVMATVDVSGNLRLVRRASGENP
jgi:N-methylhydantoinase A